MKKKLSICLLLSALILIAIYNFQFGTGRFCNESPEVHWKLAIYAGECPDFSNGFIDGLVKGRTCSYSKIEDTGLMEYLGIQESKLQKERCRFINPSNVIFTDEEVEVTPPSI